MSSSSSNSAPNNAAASIVSEIDRSLREMTGMATRTVNQKTIAEAIDRMKKLIADKDSEIADKDRESAELTKRLKEIHARSVEVQDLKLVAENDGGQSVMVNSAWAKASSEFIRKKMAWSKVQENHINTVTISFEDEFADIKILSFTKEAMYAGKEGMDVIDLSYAYDPGFMEKIIKFSSKYLMQPWVAEAAAKIVLQSAHVPAMAELVEIAHAFSKGPNDNPGYEFLIAEQVNFWKDTTMKAVCKLARKVKETSKVCNISKLSLEVVELIVDKVPNLDWSEWDDFLVPAEGSSIKSAPCKEGFGLKMCPNVAGGVDAYVHKDAFDETALVEISSDIKVVGFECEVRALPREGSNSPIILWPACSRISSKSDLDPFSDSFNPDKRSEYLHGKSFKFSFRARTTKLHWQCHAILEWSKVRLRGEQQTDVPLASILRTMHERKSLSLGLHSKIIQFVSSFFSIIPRSVLAELSCSDLKAIISQQGLDLPQTGEVGVLKAILAWHMSRVAKTSSDISTTTQRREIHEKRLGILLEHVRFPWITPEQIETVLDDNERAIAKDSESFNRLLVEATRVQLGRYKASTLDESRGVKRKYEENDIPYLDTEMVKKSRYGF